MNTQIRTFRNLILTAGLFISFGFTPTLASINNGDSTSTAKEESATTSQKLTKEEMELLSELKAEISVDMAAIEADILASLQEPAFEAFKVFDLEGNLLMEKDTNDRTEIPANAAHLLDDGTTRFFIVNSIPATEEK